MLMLALVVPLILAAAAPAGAVPRAAPVAPILTTADAHDAHSFARPEIARVTHVSLDLNADFEGHRMAGTATLDIAAAPGAGEIVLDSNGLDIAAIADARGRPLRWALGAGDATHGRPLTVQIGAARRIVIRYRSAPDAPALQWLTPEQTVGRHHPYLLSQGEAILNRSWIPTQDSPGVRQTWDARITVPAPLTAVMSGERLTPRGLPAGPGRHAFRFRMTHPVAPYLIALAVGDLAFRPLGPRTGVWTEPGALAAAASELRDTEAMVSAAEGLYGRYRWGRYDMIVLPPSFPFGGMENPTLTFLTPTVIAGDRSLVNVVAHELSHSWSGNLVTNATWSDSWLNEGFTSYAENRVMEVVYGHHRASQEEALSWDDMQAAMRQLGATSPATALHHELDDPDGTSAGIIYDKGATFLRTLERLVGRPRWDAYLRSYFARHAFEPMTSALFLADLRANLVRGDRALEERLQLDRWTYQPGVPDNAAHPDPAAFAEVDGAIRAFEAGGPADGAAFARWNWAERVRFLNTISRHQSAARLAELDRAFHLADGGNSEVLFAWLRLALVNRYDPAVPTAERFLASMGRMRFVVPLFDALVHQGEWGRPIATRIYARTRGGYHSVTRNRVDRLLAA